MEFKLLCLKSQMSGFYALNTITVKTLGTYFSTILDQYIYSIIFTIYGHCLPSDFINVLLSMFSFRGGKCGRDCKM